MVAADLIGRLSSLFHLRRVELVHDQPRARGLTRRVWAVPVLEHDAFEPQSGERLAPRAKPPGHVRGQPDVRAGRQEPFEMPLALEERHVQEWIAVDLEQVERAEDLPPRQGARERIPLLVDLEVPAVLPVGYEDAVEDRRPRVGLGLDRVEQLAGTL